LDTTAELRNAMEKLAAETARCSGTQQRLAALENEKAKLDIDLSAVRRELEREADQRLALEQRLEEARTELVSERALLEGMSQGLKAQVAQLSSENHALSKKLKAADQQLTRPSTAGGTVSQDGPNVSMPSERDAAELSGSSVEEYRSEILMLTSQVANSAILAEQVSLKAYHRAPARLMQHECDLNGLPLAAATHCAMQHAAKIRDFEVQQSAHAALESEKVLRVSLVVSAAGLVEVVHRTAE
jgi:DNA repair exonuclease SbcCD ATPase subunit